jgi:alpha-1,2-mannosyltransferase
MAPVAIGVLAFVVRLLSALHSGGLDAVFGYDEGVYFGASTSFVSGLMPYRDFLLVHPPGSLVFLAPFAQLGKVTSEPTGWMVARLAIMVIGAANAVLLYTIARRASVVAGLVAGGLYAVWGPVVHVERTTMLEAFVLFALVVALWAIPDANAPTMRLVVAGIALGLGASTKLWGLVPLVVIVGWLLVSRAWRASLVVAASAGAACAVIVVPFLVRAPEAMFDDVIRAQLGRGKGGTHEHDRLAAMFGLDLARFASAQWYGLTVGLIALAIVVLAMGIAWARVPRSRLWVVLLLVQMAVLIAVPVYFEGYSSFIGPALALVCATATGVVWLSVAGSSRTVTTLTRAALVVVIASIVGFSAYHAARTPVDVKPHIVAIAKATDGATCVGSDSAGVLIAANALSRNIERGCPTVVDFDGTVYSFKDGANPRHLGSTDRRLNSVPYQEFMRAYFAANDVLLIHRAAADSFDQETKRALHARPLLYKQRGLRIFGPGAS